MRLIRAAAATVTAVAFICCASIAGAHAQGVGVSVSLGNSHVVAAYNPERHGDWHTSYSNWQPTKLYYYKGQYYDHQAKGARAVSVYRKDDEYFLPPQDKKWVGYDKRFDYKHRPTSADYKRVP
jgi:hypothetical protein